MGFSYQTLMEACTIPEVFFDSEWFSNGASMIPLYLTVKHRTSAKGFDNRRERKKMDKFIAILQNYTEAENITDISHFKKNLGLASFDTVCLIQDIKKS